LSHNNPDNHIVQIQGLTKSYGNANTVLNGINAHIKKGERVALIGSNGSGKSTLLKCIIGLHPFSNGEVKVMGETFNKTPSSKQRKNIRLKTGFIFQQHCLVRRRSVLSNVVHGMLGNKGSWRGFSHHTAPNEWRTNAMTALHKVNLSEKILNRADSLSGGQQQRAAIARALVRDPSLIIADEPAASLDPVAGKEVMSIFSELCKDNGITLLFTSHDMEHTLEFSDRVIALKNGVVHFDKSSDSVSDKDLEIVFNG